VFFALVNTIKQLQRCLLYFFIHTHNERGEERRGERREKKKKAIIVERTRLSVFIALFK
jgi:hypothetical protein